MSLNGLGLGFLFTATDLASDVMKNVRENFVGLENAAGKSLGNIDAMTGKLAAGLTAGFIGVGGLVQAFKLAGESGHFETRMGRVRQLAHANEEEFQSLKKIAFESSNLGFAPLDAVAGMKDLAQAGYKADSILKMLPITERFAAASELDLADAIGITQQMLKGYDVQLGGVEVAMDQMVRAANVATIDVGDLQIGLGRAASGAKAIRMNLTQTATLFGLVQEVMGSSMRASTSLSVMGQTMANKTKQALLSAKGINVLDAKTGQFREIEDILGDIYTKTQKMSEGASEGFLGKVFGADAGGAVRALLGQMKKGIEGADGLIHKGREAITARIKEIGGAANETSKFSTELMGLWDNQIQIMKTKWEGLRIKVGKGFEDVFTPYIKKIIVVLQDLEDRWDKLSPKVKENIAMFTVFGAAALTVFGLVGLLGAAADLLVGGFMLVGGALGSLAATAITSVFTMWPLWALFGAIAGIVYAVQHNVGGLGEAWDRLADTFSHTGEWLQSVEDYFVEAWDLISGGFMETFDNMKPIFEELGKAFDSVREQLANVGLAMGDTKGPGDSMARVFVGIGHAVAGVIAVVTAAIGFFVKLFAWVLKAGAEVTRWFNKEQPKSEFPGHARLFDVEAPDERQLETKSELVERLHRADRRRATRNASADRRHYLMPAPLTPEKVPGDVATTEQITPQVPAFAASALRVAGQATSFSGIQPVETRPAIDYAMMAAAMSKVQWTLAVDGQRFAAVIQRAANESGARETKPR